MAETIRYAAYGYPMAEQDSAGNWQVAAPDSVSDGDWGTFRIEVGATWDTSGTAFAAAGSVAVKTVAGTDITVAGPNDAPTLIDSLTLGEPYGELTGQVTIMGLTPFDDPDWLDGLGMNVDIWRVLPAAEAVTAGTAEVPYWHGIVASIETSDGPGLTSSVSLQLMGALYGEASVRQHQPLMLDTSNDAGTWVGMTLDYALYTRPFTPFSRFSFESDTTGIDLRYRGSRGQSTIDYLDELLMLAQNSTAQWTISRAYQTLGGRTYPRARHYYLREKADYQGDGVQENTVFAGGYGVAFSISRDITERASVIYGEGVHPVDSSRLSGSRWRNAVYPLLTTAAPANPDRVSGSDYPITIGDEDADFTTDVVTQLTSQLRVSGWPDVTISDTFGSATAAAITALKEDIGWANTTGNIGGTAEWAMVWGEGGTGFTDLESGFFRPLAVGYSPVEKYTYAADGDVTGENPSYNPNVLRVERTISFGEGVAKSRARTFARRMTTGAVAPTVGTITLTSDPTDEDGVGRSRLDIREGGWIQLNNLYEGSYEQFYIASVTQSPEADGFPTVLTVSTVPYDLLDLSTRLERNRAAKSDPAKSFYSQRTDTVRPFKSAVGWDAESGAGVIPAFSAAGSAWTIKPFVGAQYGSIAALSVDAGTAVPFCFAVFGGSVAGTALDALIPNPLAAVGTADGSYPSWWSHPDNATALESYGFVEAWGSEGEAAGFYPGAQSIGAGVAAGSATGVLEDAGSWTFASLEPPYLWAAIWPQMAGTATGVSVNMRIVVEE